MILTVLIGQKEEVLKAYTMYDDFLLGVKENWFVTFGEVKFSNSVFVLFMKDIHMEEIWFRNWNFLN